MDAVFELDLGGSYLVPLSSEDLQLFLSDAVKLADEFVFPLVNAPVTLLCSVTNLSFNICLPTPYDLMKNVYLFQSFLNGH